MVGLPWQPQYSQSLLTASRGAKHVGNVTIHAPYFLDLQYPYDAIARGKWVCFFRVGIPDPKICSCHPDGDWVTIPSLGEGWTEILNNITYCRSNYGDSHDRFPPNGGLVREILLFRGKSRLVKYYSLAR